MSHENLIWELRREFLQDPEDLVGQFNTSAALLPSHFQEAFDGVLRSCHSMKGSAQAVGFKALAEALHRFEDHLVLLQRLTIDPSQHASLLKKVEQCLSSLEGDFRQLDVKSPDGQCPQFEQTLIELAKHIPSKQQLKPQLFTPVPATIGAPAPSANKGWELFEDEVEHAKPVAAAHPGFELFDEPSAMPTPAVAAVAPSPEIPPPSAKKVVPLPSSSQSYLVCELGGIKFALPVMGVREIIESRDVIQLPCTRPGIEGIITVREHALPVVNLASLRQRHEADSNEPLKRRCIVICENAGRSFGIKFDSASSVTALNSGLLQDVPAGGMSQTRKIVTQLAKLNNETLLILNLDQVLAA